MAVELSDEEYTEVVSAIEASVGYVYDPDRPETATAVVDVEAGEQRALEILRAAKERAHS